MRNRGTRDPVNSVCSKTLLAFLGATPRPSPKTKTTPENPVIAIATSPHRDNALKGSNRAA
jgi:hypothetical protein